MGHLASIYEQYKDKADFLTVYVREAHPTDEWQMDSNVKDDVCYPQPHSLHDRVVIANDFVQRFHFPAPLVIDTMANTANDLYSAWPERLYVIDTDGKIIYRGGQGPFDYHPDEVRALLAQKFPGTPAPPVAQPAPATAR